MIIKRYTTRRFAGLKDQDYVFGDGLNVLIGPNEAGKSTVVSGIQSVLFQQSKLKQNNTADKVFARRFTPLPAGDSIDGTVVLAAEGGDYTVSREWGEANSAELELPGGRIIKNEGEIQKEIDRLLRFGQGTYDALFFAKQGDLKEAIEKIVRSEAQTSEVSTLLRKAIMELDGVSVDRLGDLIDCKIKAYYEHWDRRTASPENNRDINHPYVNGVGVILGHYYHKERLRLAMRDALEAEEAFQAASDALKSAISERDRLLKARDEMANLEEDVTRRSIIEPKLEAVGLELETLGKVNFSWPQTRARAEQLDKDLEATEASLKKLEEEKKRAEQVKVKQALEKKQADVDRLKADIKRIEAEIAGLTPVTPADVEALEQDYSAMLTTEAKIKAGVLIGRFNVFNGSQPVMISKDLDDTTMLEAGETFRANGYVKLHSEDLFELEIKTGEEDFAKLREDYERHKASYEAGLARLQVTSVAGARINLQQLEQHRRDIHSLEGRISAILDGQTSEELAGQIAGLGDLTEVRSLEAVDKEEKELTARKLDQLSDKRQAETDIRRWEEAYGSPEQLFDRAVEKRSEQKAYQEELDTLKPLPEAYGSTEDFRRMLETARVGYDREVERVKDLNEAYREAEGTLPETSYEDLTAEHAAAEKQFRHSVEHGKRLLKIKEAFEETRTKVDENTFTPVLERFSEYIAALTLGTYTSTMMSDSFEISISNDDLTVPVELLSTGTYSSVALALRLTLLDYILGDEQGFLVLDDCLVDLDPERKEQAVRLIRKFAEKHQVIFSTCNPETAEQLKGQIIQI